MNAVLSLFLAINTLAIISEGTWVIIVGQAVIVLTLVINKWSEVANRKEDRENRESEARILALGLADVKKTGAEREERIVSKIDENTAMNEEALSVANGHNGKIADAMAMSVKALGASHKP